MGWLQATAEEALPEVDFSDLLGALMHVTQDIARARPPEYHEVPSRERFRRGLAHLGVDGTRAPTIAEQLSLAHMQHLAAMTVLPDGHLDAMRQLAAQRPLALVSNFDHGPTARRVLAAHGVAEFFSAIVISAEFGRRKPHPTIFAAALEALGATPNEAWYVGDSIGDDVVGGHNAGLPVVWINAEARPLPAEVAAPTHVIRGLPDLPALVTAAV
jgi:HAD superfamily hydrolase (TIGR01549 family)